MTKNILYIFLILSVVLFISGCPTFIWNRARTVSLIEEVIVPEIKIDGGGVQSSPYPSERGVYYYNASESKTESDIQLDEVIRYEQSVRRYILVSGTAIPDDSGLHLSDQRWYHAVFFKVVNKETDEEDYFSIPVDSNNHFSGHLYFKDTVKYAVFAFRNMDYLLYSRSRGTEVTIPEGSSTCYFYVNVKEAVPENVQHLMPTRNVDCGTKSIYDKAREITLGMTDPHDKARAVYEYLVDSTGDNFNYTLYSSIYPTLTDSYNDAFLASHFLLDGRGVCNDFAELYAAMMRSLGYKVKKEMGWLSPGGAGHMWNRLDLTGDTPDDEWLKIDATWGVDKGYGIYSLWAELYPEFTDTYFDNDSSGGYSHSQFSYDHRIEY